MYGWLAVVVLVLTSCDSENVTPINDKTLPEAIAKDFHERYEDYTIKRVYTRPEPYFDSGAMETYVSALHVMWSTKARKFVNGFVRELNFIRSESGMVTVVECMFAD